jgi:hypothetical protein
LDQTCCGSKELPLLLEEINNVRSAHSFILKMLRANITETWYRRFYCNLQQ